MLEYWISRSELKVGKRNKEQQTEKGGVKKQNKTKKQTSTFALRQRRPTCLCHGLLPFESLNVHRVRDAATCHPGMSLWNAKTNQSESLTHTKQKQFWWPYLRPCLIMSIATTLLKHIIKVLSCWGLKTSEIYLNEFSFTFPVRNPPSPGTAAESRTLQTRWVGVV